MNLVLACSSDEVNRERAGYAEAFERRVDLSVRPTKSALSHGSRTVLLYPDPPTSTLPENLATAECVTACFQIDAFSAPRWRARWSALFDYVFVFHPGLAHHYRTLGHRRVVTLPHAVQRRHFDLTESNREYDIGWIGTLDRAIYSARRRLLPLLARNFRMNAWQSRYQESEIPAVFKRSRIVVNIGRDDHPSDANLRCFEAMASGALLLTALPSELEDLGFRRDIHFVGYSAEGQVPDLVRRYLRDDSARETIAVAGQSLVMRHHTYDARVNAVIEAIQRDGGAHFAPARSWKKQQVDFTYLHYHCKHLNYPEAIGYFRSLAAHPLLGARGLALLGRCLWHHNRGRCLRAASDTIPKA